MIPVYPRIIAHRCGGALAPENSLAGLAIAARLGCRGVEFDAMLTADGIPILMHDETIDRTTTGSGRVAQLSADQIRKFDAGVPHHPAYAVSPAPTFAEAIARCSELGLWANIELKPAADNEEATGRTIARWLAQHWNGHGVVSSFSSAALAAARQEAAQLPLALLAETLPNDWRTQLQQLGAGSLHLAANTLTPSHADALGDTPWACYTVNCRHEADRLFALGCRAIFTDRPDLWTEGEM